MYIDLYRSIYAYTHTHERTPRATPSIRGVPVCTAHERADRSDLTQRSSPAYPRASPWSKFISRPTLRRHRRACRRFRLASAASSTSTLRAEALGASSEHPGSSFSMWWRNLRSPRVVDGGVWRWLEMEGGRLDRDAGQRSRKEVWGMPEVDLGVRCVQRFLFV